jgi:hypothetical protein
VVLVLVLVGLGVDWGRRLLLLVGFPCRRREMGRCWGRGLPRALRLGRGVPSRETGKQVQAQA